MRDGQARGQTGATGNYPSPRKIRRGSDLRYITSRHQLSFKGEECSPTQPVAGLEPSGRTAVPQPLEPVHLLIFLLILNTLCLESEPGSVRLCSLRKYNKHNKDHLCSDTLDTVVARLVTPECSKEEVGKNYKHFFSCVCV